MGIKVRIICVGAIGAAIAQTVTSNAKLLPCGRHEELCTKINYFGCNGDYFPRSIT